MRIVLFLIFAAALFPSFHRSPIGSASVAQVIPADPVLDDATVNGWFDRNITRGDGQACPVRSGNEVTELVDGVVALKTMSDTMRAAQPNLTVLKTFGSAPGDPLYPREFGSCVE